MPKSSYKNIPTAPSILIILMGSLGDVARGLCLVAHLKANLPQCRVSWLVEPKWAELVKIHAQIDKVITFQRAWRFSAVWELHRNLRQESFDITLDLQRILKSGFFTAVRGPAAGRFSPPQCQRAQLDLQQRAYRLLQRRAS